MSWGSEFHRRADLEKKRFSVACGAYVWEEQLEWFAATAS